MPTLKIGTKAQIKGKGKAEHLIYEISNGLYWLENTEYPYAANELIPVKEKPVVKKKFKINTHSPLRKILSSIYSIIHFEYLALPENKICRAQLNGCSHKATQIHHTFLRTGYYLIMSKRFFPICSNCHDFVNEDSDEAIRLGISVSRKSNVPYEFTPREVELMEEFGVSVPG